MFNPDPPHLVRSPFMLQSWNYISFLHWRCNAALLQRRLPRQLFVDQFEGSAWISLTPFLLENLRPPLIPAVPWLSRFPETNLRTYVNGPSGAGIWFFSLDAQRLAAAIGARTAFGLPYYWADMRLRCHRDRVRYYSSRGGRATARIEVEIGPPIEEPDELATFLVARFRLYSVRQGQLLSVAVQHKSWPLRRAQVIRLQETVTDAAGFHIHDQAPLVHFSPGVDVRVAAASKEGLVLM